MSSLNPSFGPYGYNAAGSYIESWKEDRTTRDSIAAAARSNSARRRDGFLGPREITIEGLLVTHGTRDDFRDALAAFHYAHREGFRPLMREDDREIYAQAQAVTTAEDPTRNLASTFTVRFVCPDPYWRELTPVTDTWLTPVTGGVRTIPNPGTAPGAPVFTITVGTVGSPTAIDLTLILDTPTTDIAQFELTPTVSTGDVLVVDAEAMTVKLNGSNKLSAFTGSFFLIPPGGGTARLLLSGAPLASIDSSLVPRYL